MSSEQTATSVVVRAVLTASPADLFALLSDPTQHVRLDGSGSVRGVVEPGVLTTVGQVFVMDMSRPEIGDYRTENTVTVCVPDTSLAWTTTRPPTPAPGFWWRWDLRAADGGTEVTHTCDWSEVTDPAVLARVNFPRITPDEMRATVDRLAVAVHRTPPRTAPADLTQA